MTKEQLKERRAQLIAIINSNKSYLNKTDYQAIKYAEGVLSLDEYNSIKLLRQKARDNINEAQVELVQVRTRLKQLQQSEEGE